MEDLTPVGRSRDGKRLVLIGAQGQEYSVAIDRRLRTALGGDQARLGQLEMTMESTLRPRDIQNRIRAGASAEEVAAAAQTTVEKIMGFAGPVLAERAHVAQTAQASSVRRKHAESGSARTLGDATAGPLRELGVHDDEVTWDAWRREDGRWTLVADYVADDRPRHAEFTYDARGRYVVADNEEARVLTGESTRRAAGTGTRARAGQGRRLSAVPDQDALPLGDDAIELVSDPDRAETPEVDRAAEVAEPGEPAEPDELTADHADADWIAVRDAEHPDADRDTDRDADREPTVEVTGAGPEPETRSEPEPETQPEPQARPAAARASRRRGRAPVPSWDEIMFGGGGGRPE